MTGDETQRPSGAQPNVEELLRRLTPPTDQLKAFQQMMSLFPAAMEQRQAFQQLFTQMFLPPERLRMARELMRTLTPPAEQLEAVQRELSAQREQLNDMLRELESMERSIARLATVGEQVRATQDSFVSLMSLFMGGANPPGKRGTATEPDAGDDGP